MKDKPAPLLRYRVLAGIVMTRGAGGRVLEDGAAQAAVVCIATGSKCISGGNLCMRGRTLNDCHAEVLARRCLVRFLYDQVLLILLCACADSVYNLCSKLPTCGFFFCYYALTKYGGRWCMLGAGLPQRP